MTQETPAEPGNECLSALTALPGSFLGLAGGRVSGGCPPWWLSLCDGNHEVERYAEAFGGIWDACLDEARSRSLIRRAAEEFGK
jgi:hypothetical protein